MVRTIEATVDEQGAVHLSESITLPAPQRALVTILDEEPLAADVDMDEGLRRGFADIDAGRTLSLAESRAEFDALWAARFGPAA